MRRAMLHSAQCLGECFGHNVVLTVRKSEPLNNAAEWPINANSIRLHCKLILGVGFQPTDEDIFVRAAKKCTCMGQVK